MDKNNSVAAFIQRWQGVNASELATAQSFVMDFCELLGVAKPHATPEQDYMFERPVTFAHGDGSSNPGRIDCYRRGHFVLEAKKLKAVADELAQAGGSLDLDALAAHFSSRGRWRERLPVILDALVALGRAQTQGDGRWVDAGR
jgi:hypothetical protein